MFSSFRQCTGYLSTGLMVLFDKPATGELLMRGGLTKLCGGLIA